MYKRQLILFIVKLFDKHITFELHQVIKNIGELEKHINIKNYFLKKFLNLGLIIYYWALGVISDKIIVFEQELKNRLTNIIPLKKIEALSIGVYKNNSIAKNIAKQKIRIPRGKFLLLVFGFINGYKGIDWIIKASYVLQKNIHLLIAGGKNPYLKDKPHYKRFYRGLANEAKKREYITHTGFIPDSKVGLYFSAADLVIMPYEVFMSASGPFSLALEYKKPVMFSEALSNYQKSLDFAKAMDMVGLKGKDLFFKLNQQSLFYLVNKAMKNRNYYAKLINFSKTLSKMRAIDKTTARLNNMLMPENTAQHI